MDRLFIGTDDRCEIGETYSYGDYVNSLVFKILNDYRRLQGVR